MTEDLDSLTWLKACGTSACLEIAYHEDRVHLRPSEAPEKAFSVTKVEWRQFVEAIHSGAIA